MRLDRRLLASAGITTAAAGLLLAVSAPFLAGSAAAAPTTEGCDPGHAITAFHFTVNGKTVPSLHGALSQGDQVTAFFTIGAGCRNVAVALVAHTAPDPHFVRAHVGEQRVFDAARGTFSAGSHSLGPVKVPSCDFQVDFEALGTKAVPGHTYSSDTGGTTTCGSGESTTTTVLPTTTTVHAATTEPPTTAARPTTTAAQVLAEQTPTGTLPLTGNDTGLLVAIAAILIVGGGAMIGLANHPAHRSVHATTAARD
jgi:hypothetical protein